MTADTYSGTLGLLLMGTGNDNNSWGANLNSYDLQIIEDAIANALTSVVTGGTLDLSGSPPPAAPSQVRYAALIFSGALASNQIVQVPNLRKFWFVQNATSGAFTLTLKTPTGAASTAIPQNSGWQIVYCDGADGIVVHPFNTAQVQMPDGSVGAPSFSYLNEAKSGWYRAGTQDHRLSINGVDVLQVTGAGAGTPSIFNLLLGAMQIGGAQVVPAGAEIEYSGIELPAGGWLWTDGSAYSRPIADGGAADTYKSLFDAITKTATATIASGSNVLTAVSADLRAKGLKGGYIEGAGIPTGTTVTAITATSITMSANATGSSAGAAIRILPYGQGDATTTFNVPDRRSRVSVPRDDLGGTPANRMVVNDATQLSLVGGEEVHTITLPELPSHTHTPTLTDPGHFHTNDAYPNLAGGGTGNNPGAGTGSTFNTRTATTGITISIASVGSGAAHNNMQNFGVCNKIIKI